jgi:hypothetical protein
MPRRPTTATAQVISFLRFLGTPRHMVLKLVVLVCRLARPDLRSVSCWGFIAESIPLVTVTFEGDGGIDDAMTISSDDSSGMDVADVAAQGEAEASTSSDASTDDSPSDDDQQGSHAAKKRKVAASAAASGAGKKGAASATKKGDGGSGSKRNALSTWRAYMTGQGGRVQVGGPPVPSVIVLVDAIQGSDSGNNLDVLAWQQLQLC